MHEHRTPAGTTFATLEPLPERPAKPKPTLLLLAMAAAETLGQTPYNRIGQRVAAAGWLVVGLDLPAHGADAQPGEPTGLAGWRARFDRGEDFVADLQWHAADVLVHLVGAGHSDRARLATAGTSRGGFMATQVAAAVPEVRAVVAFAPVADLAALSEFAGVADPARLAALALARQAAALANRALWVTIGSADQRVDTDRTITFTRAVTAASVLRGLPLGVTLQVLPVPGHASAVAWHEQAADWLLATVSPSG